MNEGIGTMAAMQQNQQQQQFDPRWQYGPQQQAYAGQPMYSFMDQAARIAAQAAGNLIHQNPQAHVQQMQQAAQQAATQPQGQAPVMQATQGQSSVSPDLRKQVGQFVKEVVSMAENKDQQQAQGQDQPVEIPGWVSKTGYVAAGAAGFWGLGKIKKAIFGGNGGGGVTAQDGDAVMEALKAFMR